MIRKVAAGAALVVAALTLGSAAGARHVASDQPAITVDATESVVVSDDSISAPPADAGVDEAVAAADQVGVFPPAEATAAEAVTAADQVGVFPPADATVAEAVGVADSVVVVPSIAVDVHESVGVSDEAVAVPPVATHADEAVGVTDAVDVALNSAPTASAGGPYSVDEGSSVRLNGSGIDPEGGPLTFLWAPSTRLDDPSLAQPTYSAPDDAVETLTLTVKDAHGLTGSAHTVVTVKNVAPVLAPGGEADLPAGSLLFRTVAFTDPGTDSWSGTVDFGDGSPRQTLLVPSRALILSHMYATPGVFTVHMSVSDDDGGTDSASFRVRVLNTAPQVSAGSDVTLNEGATLTRTGTITDTPDTWTGTVDYGDGGGPSALAVSGNSFSLSHVYRDNGDYAVHVSVSDSHGATGTAGFTAHVRNVAPIVGAIIGAPPGAVRVGAPVSLRAPFTDPGTLDTFTSTWRWGDGSTSPGAVNAGMSSASHAYAAAGVYSVTVSVTDDDGGSGESAAATVLVYNPQAGSVIGAGKLSGEGAFALALRNEGGTTRGSVEFSTGRGGIVFHADSFDWLLTARGCALTTGRGRVDGRTGFSFWVTAVQTDGRDRFRIRIWRTATGAAVVDTGSGPLTDCTTPDRVAEGFVVVRSG
jgi:PKD repeat protein